MIPKAQQQKVPVTERALVQRINRAVHDDDLMLRKPRSERVRITLGTYYLVDWRRNFVTDKDVDLEAYGRELGVLNDWETLAEED